MTGEFIQGSHHLPCLWWILLPLPPGRAHMQNLHLLFKSYMAHVQNLHLLFIQMLIHGPRVYGLCGRSVIFGGTMHIIQATAKEKARASMPEDSTQGTINKREE